MIVTAIDTLIGGSYIRLTSYQSLIGFFSFEITRENQ